MTSYPTRIPDEDDWAGYENDMEASYAHELIFGKSYDDVMYDFRYCAIERAEELVHVPRRVFQYYVFAFVQLFNSPDESVGQSDCASVFLQLLCRREKHDPGSVAQIYSDLRSTVEHVAANQVFYEAPVDIYGDFCEHARQLKALCEAPHARR